jgi:hypothetical protein
MNIALKFENKIIVMPTIIVPIFNSYSGQEKGMKFAPN